jgi:hypothetical protein
VKAMNLAIIYTQNRHPDKKDYFDTLTSLRVSVDELRGIYQNSNGLNPFSPVLTVQKRIAKLGYGDVAAEDIARRKRLEAGIFVQWKHVREAFLSELDRPMSRSADVSLWHADLVSYPVEVPLRERPFDGAAVTAHVPSDTSLMIMEHRGDWAFVETVESDDGTDNAREGWLTVPFQSGPVIHERPQRAVGAALSREGA